MLPSFDNFFVNFEMKFILTIYLEVILRFPFVWKFVRNIFFFNFLGDSFSNSFGSFVRSSVEINFRNALQNSFEVYSTNNSVIVLKISKKLIW